MKLTIYTANVQGQEHNCLYPNRIEVVDAGSFKQAVSFDHVAAYFKNSYRNSENFMVSDHVGMDCDNERSDDPKDWIYPEEVSGIFSGVAFAIATSRNHRKPKGGKSARPRFHVYFPIAEVKDDKAYGRLKEQLADRFPFFDPNALDQQLEDAKTELSKAKKALQDAGVGEGSLRSGGKTLEKKSAKSKKRSSSSISRPSGITPSS